MKLFLGILFVAIASAEADVDKSLDGSKVYNVFPKSTEDFELIYQIETTLDGVDIWQRASVLGREARIMVLNESRGIFELLMKVAGIHADVFIDDVATVFEYERSANIVARSDLPKDGKISFTAFHRHAEINAYLDGLAASYPGKVTVRTLGNTSEGRALKAIIISTTGGTDASKPVIISDAGIHAREWAAPALALYMITKLVEDITESDVVEKIDWVIIPVLNPDGYEYSHTTYRLWRKTRSTVSSTDCPGVDGNRNFDFHWMESGGSNYTCSETFAGGVAFSEPETKYLRDLITEYKSRAKAYLAIHSYGSYFLYPYGYNGLPTPDDVELDALGKLVGNAIDAAAVPGSTKYLVGNSGSALNYLAAGASDDYAYGIGGIKYAYTIELPGADNGFEMPPSKILQTVQETWQGILVFARYVIDH